jgi:hypothetical protein
MKDFLFRGDLEHIDPAVYELTQLEAERQVRKLIMIPSESQAPLAVRDALSSAFQNIYAEGYPREETRWMSEAEIVDFPARLVHFGAVLSCLQTKAPPRMIFTSMSSRSPALQPIMRCTMHWCSPVRRSWAWTSCTVVI